MPQQQRVVMLTLDFVTALVNRGILPDGTTTVSAWAGNRPDGLGGYEKHIEIVIENANFADVPDPPPISAVNVPTEIVNLGA